MPPFGGGRRTSGGSTMPSTDAPPPGVSFTGMRRRSSNAPEPQYAPGAQSISRAAMYASPREDAGQPKVKLMLLGESATGKTCITKQFISKKFDPVHRPTVAVDFNQTSLTVGAQVVRLALWNLAQNKDGNLSANPFRGLHGAFVVVDISQPHTIASLPKWIKIINSKLASVGEPPVPVGVLVNKMDRIDEEHISFNRNITEKLCKKHGYMGWFATSAKDGSNVEFAFKEMLIKILQGPHRLVIDSRDIQSLGEDVEGIKVEKCSPRTPPTEGVGVDFSLIPETTGGCACTIS
ncbi:unnamed protein product [Chrysoparadoxa australica]